MLTVALTGGIATGKTYVRQGFARLGVPTLDADTLAHGAMGPETEVTEAIVGRFGPGVLAADGSVDRGRLAPIVFADAVARRHLEAIVHPAVRRAIAAGLKAFELTGGAPFAVVDIPLLFEAGRAADFDRVIATCCSEEQQRERLAARGLPAEQAEARLAAQLPAADKAARADFVIQTGGTFAETDAQIARIHQVLTELGHDQLAR